MSDIPQSAISLLQSGTFLHLGTSKNDTPHVSLMNYTYIPPNEGEPFESEGVVIIATPKDTQKFEYIQYNPKVSLLLHDWVTARSLESADVEKDSQQLSGLKQFLQDLNQSQMSSISATFSGLATILKPDSDEEKFFRDKHTKAHSKEARCFFDNAAIVLIKIQTVTIADTHNRVTRNSVSY